MSFVEFRKYANTRLNILKEECSTQYGKYVMKNFGKLQESVNTEDLYRIAKMNDLQKETLTFVKNAIYKEVEYDYFVYDGIMCVGVNKDGKIVYIGDFYKESLSDGVIYK